MKEFDQVTPEWVKAQMKEYKLSGKDLAQLANTTQSSVSRWNKGDIGSMSKATLYWIFNYLRLKRVFQGLEQSDVNVLKG